MKINPIPWWSAHTHSRYSAGDALPSVEAMVARVADLGQPALGLTDHGNIAGAVELYKACHKAGIAPFPGSEFYFVPEITAHKADRANRNGQKAQRYHLGVLAHTTKGYENLVALSTQSWRQHFHKPLVDFATLAEFAEDGRTKGLAVTTGCYFGYAVQQLITNGEASVEQFLATLSSWFPRSVYVEIQNHGIDHGDGWSDDTVAEAMVGIADRLGLPVVITQDAHYEREEHKPLHDSLKQLHSFSADPDDAVFPGDGFHLADSRWIREHHHLARLERGLEGLGDLLSRHELSIPVLDHYAYAVPALTVDPDERLRKRCERAIAIQGRSRSKKYRAKLEEELEVIKISGMADYMLLVAEVTDYMHENHIVFQTRGSAAGSLVCWLLGISNVDPLKWDLRFERFLSKDRTKPPDIDLDIAHDRRQELLEWLNTRFTAHQIGSWAKYSLNPEDDEEEGGSLLRKYFSTAAKYGRILEKVAEIPEEDYAHLRELSDLSCYRGMGTNAAGIVITATPREFDTIVPITLMPRGGYVSQYHLKSIEDMGLVKLDVLGSKTLSVLKLCCDNLGWDIAELESIPLKDRPTYATMRSGQTAGIFQLEGKSSQWGTKSLRPDRIEDVIAAMALFRPGVQRVHGDKYYIARKHGKEEVPQRHELIERVTKDTYGIMLYQEQVIDVLRALGMGADDLTTFLKAVKASNANIGAAADVIASYSSWIDDKCIALGMNDEDKKFLEEAIAGFAEYGFNRAHATVYGLTAYRCAYLATHHPVEFHAALLAVSAGGEKENHYLKATRSRGVRVLQPSLNVSGATYTVDKDKRVIRRGLLSIDGVGIKGAEVLANNGPYEDLDHLVRRVAHTAVNGWSDYDGSPESLTGTLAKLRDQGFLDFLIVKNMEKRHASV